MLYHFLFFFPSLTHFSFHIRLNQASFRNKLHSDVG